MPGKKTYVRATGVASAATHRPMSADSSVRIGSETKTFTVTSLLELVDDGRIKLVDPISAYVHGVPNGRRITLRQLAEMRSGLFPYTSDPDFGPCPARRAAADTIYVMSVQLNEAARQILDDTNYAVLATVSPDGSPQTSVVWIGRDGDDVLISTAAGRRKEKNLRREPRASLSVFDKDNPLRYIEIRGTATVTPDTGRELAVALAEKYAGPGAGEEFLSLPPEVVRVVVRITPDRVLGNAAS